MLYLNSPSCVIDEAFFDVVAPGFTPDIALGFTPDVAPGFTPSVASGVAPGVASDVASKGLDFPDIQHVINYDMPKEIENYGIYLLFIYCLLFIM